MSPLELPLASADICGAPGPRSFQAGIYDGTSVTHCHIYHPKFHLGFLLPHTPGAFWVVRRGFPLTLVLPIKIL